MGDRTFDDEHDGSVLRAGVVPVSDVAYFKKRVAEWREMPITGHGLYARYQDAQQLLVEAESLLAAPGVLAAADSVSTPRRAALEQAQPRDAPYDESGRLSDADLIAWWRDQIPTLDQHSIEPGDLQHWLTDAYGRLERANGVLAEIANTNIGKSSVGRKLRDRARALLAAAPAPTEDAL